MFVRNLKRVQFIAGFVLIDLILDFLLKNTPHTYKIIAGIVLLTITFFIVKKILSEYQTAGIILAVLASIVAYSTFLHKTNIYFTFWFNVLFGLLLVSILACIFALKPKFNLRYMSFLTLHLSILIVATGFLVNALGMKKCYFPLEKGKPTNDCLAMKNTEVTEKKVNFPFAVTLQDFKVLYYEQRPVLGVFLKSGREYSLIKTFPLEIGKEIFGLKFKGFSDAAIELRVLWGEGREGVFPIGRIIIGQRGAWAFSTGDEFPGLISVANERERKLYLPIKRQPIFVGKVSVAIPEDFYPNFKYDIKEKRAFSDGNEMKNPAVKLRIITPRGEKETFIFATVRRALKLGNYVISYIMDTKGLSLIAPYKVFPKKTKLEILRGIFKEDGEEFALLPNDEPYFNGRFAYRLLTIPPQEKEYKSVLKVNSRIFRVRVNHPYKYKGYMFYQSNYNPANPDFSGIMVVKEPGELLLYIGFVLMSIGALLTVAYRRKVWS